MARNTAKKTATAPAKTTTPARTPPAPSSSSSPRDEDGTAGLPTVGELVRYDATDPLTGEQLAGVGVVLDSYTHGSGDDEISRVNLARLSADLNLSAGDVSALG